MRDMMGTWMAAGLVSVACAGVLSAGCDVVGDVIAGLGNANGTANGNDNAAPGANDNANGAAGANTNDNADGGANTNGNGGANANDNAGAGANANDNAAPLTPLAAITFDGDVPAGPGPTTIDVGGGTVQFIGGSVGTAGIPPLYASGLNAWNLDPDGTATITFSGLNVGAVSLYFARLPNSEATLVAEDAAGNVLASEDAFEATTMGDPGAVVTIDGGGAFIARLSVDVPFGATVAIDDLTLSVAP